MSDTTFQVTDPQQLSRLLEEVNGLKEIFSNAARREAERGKRDLYKNGVTQLLNADLPFIELSRSVYKNKSDASMRSQFKNAAEEMNAGFEPSLIEYDGRLLLCNFDAENAAEKFNAYILKIAGIDEKELYKLAADLDTNTK